MAPTSTVSASAPDKPISPISLQKPAKCLQDCIVGPSESEKTPGNPCWGSHKHSNDNNNNNDNNESTLERAVQTFRSSGCCVLPNVLPHTFVQACLDKATSDFELLNRQLEQRQSQAANSQQSHQLAQAYRVDYREMVDRDGLRRDVRYNLHEYPYTAPGLVYNSITFPLIQALFGNGTTGSSPQLLYMGVMWARTCSSSQRSNQARDDKNDNVDPQSTSQKWHGDGGHLFDQVHLPSHCINVFYPLIDITNDHGPTHVRPGSHQLGHFDNDSLSSFGLTAQAGDALLFDYRLKHAGGLNVSDQNRPILYLAYAAPWFRDAGNTRSGHSLFDDHSSFLSSPPWVSRLLVGQALDMGQGWEDLTTANHAGPTQDQTSSLKRKRPADADTGAGERWILFRLNVQLDSDNDNDERPQETIVVHANDVPVQLATQFCLQHKLSHDFIPVLTDTLEQQMKQAFSRPQSQSQPQS